MAHLQLLLPQLAPDLLHRLCPLDLNMYISLSFSL